MFTQRRSLIYGVSAEEKANLFSGCGIAGIYRFTCPRCQNL